MTQYQVGTRFEHKVIADLRANGYITTRAAGSKGSSKIDVVALKPGQALFVQCKARGVIPAGEWNRLLEVAGWVGAVPVLAANGPLGRGVTYTRLLGPKVPRQRVQAAEVFVLDEVVA